MELNNTLTVPVPVDEAWLMMLNIAQLAPCMPGATVDEIQGDDVLGRVKVKLGPVSITYRGRLSFAEKSEDSHRVVLNAAGREMTGSGTASAHITAVLASSGDGTLVTVTTDLNITGKPAQFGRSLMADVSERIMGQFAANLARQLEAGQIRVAPGLVAPGPVAPGPVAPGLGAPAASPAQPVIASAPEPARPPSEPAPPARRLAPVLAAGVAVAGLAILLRAMSRRVQRAAGATSPPVLPEGPL
jgi:uncharacterized protein